MKGYPVQKAIGNYNSREIVAWYTDKIPVSDRPSYYQGLPGLILNLQFGNTDFTASKISFPKELKVEKIENSKRKPISLAEYNKIEDKYFERKKQEVQKKGGTLIIH